MDKPRIRIKIFTTMAIVVAIPVVILSLMLAVLSARSENQRRLDRFTYAQSFLSALIEDRNRQVIARTMLVSEDPRLHEALVDPLSGHQKLLILMAEYGLDGYIISTKEDSGILHLLDQSINNGISMSQTPPDPVVNSSAILLFHSELLERSGYTLSGVGSIKRSELEVLRAGVGAEVDIMYKNDSLKIRVLTTNRDSFGRNLAGTEVEPALNSNADPESYPGLDQPLGSERHYTLESGQERSARLISLAPVLDTWYIANISFPHGRLAISEVAAHLIIFTLITIILATLASQLLARQIVDPIQTLLYGIDNLSVAIDAQDEFQPLPLVSRDEIGELTEAYNRMGVRLQGAYASLTSRNEALKELDSIKNQFLATTSRELRSPLTTIIAQADSLVATASLHPAQVTNLRMIADSGRRLYGMVNDILDYTRLEHSDIELATRTVDLKPLVDTVLRFCLSIKKPGTELLNLVEPGRQIHCDEARLEQVLYKLVGRAIKSTTNGTISVRSWEEESILNISVNRTGLGPGMRATVDSQKNQPNRVPDAQQQLPDLDMGIASHLVKLHGGELDFQTKEDGTVVIRLSAIIPAATGQGPAAPLLS